MEVKCVNCNKVFVTRDKRRKFCSHRCADTFNSSKRKANWEEILKYYDEHFESGLTYIEMSKSVGCSVTTFRKVCVLNNRIKPLTKRQAEIKNLYTNGSSIKEISVITNDSIKNIKACLKTLGIYKVDSKLETRSCIVCEKEFTVPNYSNKKFCSDSFQRLDGHRRNDIIRKRLKNKSVLDSDITLKKLYARDGGICQICGSACDWNDYRYVNGKKHSSRMYPTIDHIVPLKKGGFHCWGNIQLAHMSCNSSKGAS